MKVLRILLLENSLEADALVESALSEIETKSVDRLSNAEVAIEHAERSRYQLIVLNLDLIEGDRLRVVERVRQVSPASGVICLTSHPDLREAVQAIRLGAEDYVGKPFRRELFLESLKRVLNRETLFEGEDSAKAFLRLVNACQLIMGSPDSARLLDILRSYLERELRSDHSAFYKVDENGATRIRLESPESRERDDAVEQMLDIVVVSRQPFQRFGSEAKSYAFFEKSQLSPGFFVFRFWINRTDPPIFLVVLSPTLPKDLEVFESALRILGTQIEISGKQLSSFQDVQELIFRDEVTGLFNARYLREYLESRSNERFAILFIDLDRFKKVNDEYGHLIGSELLLAVARELPKYVRKSDVVFRYGGDEFVVVLSKADEALVRRIAERIRIGIESSEFSVGESLKLKITASIGVARYPDDAKNVWEVLELADQAMYSVKRSSTVLT